MHETAFELWWAEYMPGATRERAWAAWSALPRAADTDALPLVRFAARWNVWARAMAEASACEHSVGGHPFFKSLERVAGTKLRRFTADELGEWVDVAGEEWKASRPAMRG